MAVHYLVSFLVLQSSHWGRESWLICFNCLLMSFDCFKNVIFCVSFSRCPGHIHSFFHVIVLSSNLKIPL